MRLSAYLLPLIAACSLSAQEAITKFVVFIPERVIQNSVHGRKLFTEVEVLGKNLEEKLQAKGQEGQKLQAQLQSASISEAGKEALQKQLRDLEFEFKKLQEDAQRDYQKTQQKVFAQFQEEVLPIIEAIAKEQKIQVVFSYTNGLIAYADKVLLESFTNEVIKRFDAKYESGAPAPAAPAKKEAKPAAPKK